MSELKDILNIIRRFWKILLKWLLRIHNYPEINVDELFNRINSEQPPLLIDIRDTADFNGVGYSKYGHISNARSIPILELESSLEGLDSFKEKEIVTIHPQGTWSLSPFL